MEWLLIGLFVTAVSYFMNSGERAAAKKDALDLQHDAQGFESEEADKARQWQEDFYLKYQSPESLMSQYRNLGASESASLMSALGVSPSIPSSVKASSSPAGGLGAGVNTMSDLLNSLTGGFNQMMQGQKTQEETKWLGPINQANIDRTLGDLEIHWKEFGLQEKTFYDISKPLAEMSLNKTQQDINESIARIDNLEEQDKLLQQQVKESEQNVNESIVRTDLYGEQINTEIAKQENLAADTSLKESQTRGQDLENRLSTLDVEVSEVTGINVRLGVSNQGALIVTSLGKRVADNLPAPPFTDKSALPFSDFLRSCKVTLQALNASKLNQYTSRSAYQYAWDYVNNHFKGKPYERLWLQKRNRIDKKARDWIDKNTRYGM